MRDHDDSPSRERWVGGSDEMEEDGYEKARQSSKHRSRDKGKSGSHREDKGHKSRDREREKTSHGSKDREKESKELEKKSSHSSKDREKESKELDKDHFSGRDIRKEDKDELERERNRDRIQERDSERDHYKDRERDRKDRNKEKDRERERDRDWEVDTEWARDKERRKDKTWEKEREKERERERENEHDRSRNISEKEKIKERTREKEKEPDRDDVRPRDTDIRSHKHQDESHERSRDSKLNDKSRMDSDADQDLPKQLRGSNDAEDESETLQNQHKADDKPARSYSSTKELEDRIQKKISLKPLKHTEEMDAVQDGISKALLELEGDSENRSFSSLESKLSVCKKDLSCSRRTNCEGSLPYKKLDIRAVPKSQVLGKVKDFLEVITVANKQLERNSKEDSGKYDIEVLTGKESEFIEMDLMLGVADLHTPEAVAAAESTIAGYQPAISLDAGSSDEDDGSNDDNGSDEERDGNIKITKFGGRISSRKKSVDKNLKKRQKIVEIS